MFFQSIVVLIGLLGKPSTMERNDADNLVKATFEEFQKKHCSEENFIICNITEHETLKYSQQVVNGQLFDITLKTNIGTTELSLWKQQNIVKMQDFKLDGKSYDFPQLEFEHL
jgi:hypothetical protein